AHPAVHRRARPVHPRRAPRRRPPRDRHREEGDHGPRGQGRHHRRLRRRAAVPPALGVGDAAVRGGHRARGLGLPYWAAFLIVAGVFVVISAVLGLVAFLVSKKLRAPETTIETAQSAVQAVQGRRRRNAVSYDDTFEELYGKQVSARAD